MEFFYGILWGLLAAFLSAAFVTGGFVLAVQ